MPNHKIIFQYLIRGTEVKCDTHQRGQEPRSEFSEDSDLFSTETEISANSSKK